MTLLAGRAAGAGRRDPRVIGAHRRARLIRSGWHVAMGDGRIGLVVEDPVEIPLGKIAADVSWNGMPPELITWPVDRRVWTRTVAEQWAYVEGMHAAVMAAAEQMEGKK